MWKLFKKLLLNLSYGVDFVINYNLKMLNETFNPPTAYEELTNNFTKEDWRKFDKANHMLTSEKYSEVEILKESGEKITLSVNIWSEDKKGKI